MDIKLFLIEALKAHKTNVSFNAFNLSDITIDAFIRIAIRDSKTSASYKFKRNKETNEITVDFTYIEEKEETAPLNKGKVSSSTIFLKGIDRNIEEKEEVTPYKNEKAKYVHLRERGDMSYVLEMDLYKSHLFAIHTSSAERTLKNLRQYSYYLTGMLEGVTCYRVNGEVVDDEEIIYINLELGIPYGEFKHKLELGHKRAKEVAKEITNGIPLDDAYKVLLTYAYIQKNVKYNFDYLKEIEAKPFSFETQRIENAMVYGALNDRLAVCEGFSWAMIYILKNLGVEAEPSFGKIEKEMGHQWVKVKVNGEWYNVDPTIIYNDPEVAVARFLISDNALRGEGYVIHDLNKRAISKKYENNNLGNFLEEFSTNLPSLIKQGLPSYWKDYIFLEAELKA